MWASAKSWWLPPGAPFVILHAPPPSSDPHLGQGLSGALALGSAPELKVIKEKVGNRSVSQQGFAIFFIGCCGEGRDKGSWGAGTVPALGGHTVHLRDKIASALERESKGRAQSSG